MSEPQPTAAKLAAIAAQPQPAEGRRIYLRADRGLDYGRVMAVMGELNRAGLACGLTYGELIQDAEARKLLILFREAPSPERRHCVYQWARKRHLKLVVIDSIKFPEE